jgi:uncharacterized protein (TIGR02598 family)
MNRIPPSKDPIHRPRGFSLIETVISMGIVGFAFIAILGILPCGLQVFRQAMDLTLEAQMVQHLIGTARQNPYGDLADLAGRTFYFDDTGNRVTEDSPRCAYAAEVTLDTQTAIPGAPAYSNTGLAGLSITFNRIHANPSSANATARTFVTYIAARSGSIN